MTYGGYSKKIVAHEDFVLRISDKLPLAGVAPLLCAGLIGYRSLVMAGTADQAKKLGIYGFGAAAHIIAQVACQRCHGPVETMDRVRQVETLAMGWCVNCHRDVNQTGVAGKPVHASIDCVTCHY